MKSKYIEFSTSKVLKNIGYKLSCDRVYDINGDIESSLYDNIKYSLTKKLFPYITVDDAKYWLLKNKNVLIVIDVFEHKFIYKIINLSDMTTLYENNKESFITYDVCVEFAIIKACSFLKR